jgi:hypothetical protein
MMHYCTYFDRGYLTRGLALYLSLAEHASPFRLWILCLDDETYDALHKLNLPHANLIQRQAFEAVYPQLAEPRATRSKAEYYFTCTPFLPDYVLGCDSSVDLITYLDADLLFFSDPAQIFDPADNGSIFITPHRYTEQYLHTQEWYGIYNVSWVSFRRDTNGMACLKWWQDRCVEWCQSEAESGRYGDQKYLDEFPRLFEGVESIAHSGAGLAPWNLSDYVVQRGAGGQVMVNDLPLIFYHYHQFKRVRKLVVVFGVRPYEVAMTRETAYCLFKPYVRALHEAEQALGWDIQIDSGKPVPLAKIRELIQKRWAAITWGTWLLLW